MKTLGTAELRTERLTLRRLEEKDAASLMECGSIDSGIEEAAKTVKDMIRDYDNPLYFHWVIEYEGKAVGRIKAWEVSRRDNYAQLGYDIGLSFRGKGLMTEALEAVIVFLLKDAGLNRVYCQIRETNIPSIKVCEKAGMKYEGTLRGHFIRPDGGYDNVLIYGILHND